MHVYGSDTEWFRTTIDHRPTRYRPRENVIRAPLPDHDAPQLPHGTPLPEVVGAYVRQRIAAGMRLPQVVALQRAAMLAGFRNVSTKPFMIELRRLRDEAAANITKTEIVA